MIAVTARRGRVTTHQSLTFHQTVRSPNRTDRLQQNPHAYGTFGACRQSAIRVHLPCNLSARPCSLPCNFVGMFEPTPCSLPCNLSVKPCNFGHTVCSVSVDVGLSCFPAAHKGLNQSTNQKKSTHACPPCRQHRRGTSHAAAETRAIQPAHGVSTACHHWGLNPEP